MIHNCRKILHVTSLHMAYIRWYKRGVENFLKLKNKLYSACYKNTCCSMFLIEKVNLSAI